MSPALASLEGLLPGHRAAFPQSSPQVRELPPGGRGPRHSAQREAALSGCQPPPREVSVTVKCLFRSAALSQDLLFLILVLASCL